MVTVTCMLYIDLPTFSAGYMYWTDYVEDVVYRANLTTGEDQVAIVSEHLPEPGIIHTEIIRDSRERREAVG